MTFKLVALVGTQSLAIPQGRVLVVGRSAGCDFAVRDLTVSRRHGEVEATEEGVRFHDLGSTNGVFLNGERVTEGTAVPGSRLAFGKVVFEVQGEEEQPAASQGELLGEGSLDAAILREVEVPGPADIASHLADPPSDGSRLRIAGDTPEGRLAARQSLLFALARELSRPTGVKGLFERVARLILQVMCVDRIAVLTRSAAGELQPRVGKSRASSPTGGWRVPRSVTRRVVAEKVAVLVEGPQGAATGKEAVQSALCAPLVGAQGAVFGVLYVENLDPGARFTGEDLEFLTAFAGLVALTIEHGEQAERTCREALVLANFQRYLSPELARQMAEKEGEVRLGGTKRRVVVLFADIHGFSALSDELTSGEIAYLLSEYFTEMVEIIFQHGGTLDKFMGDAVMALWGAPFSREDDGDRAVQAAIAMQRELERLNGDWRRQGRRALSIGIAINSGEVFAGNIGSEHRLDFTAVGSTVGLTAHLCGEAAAGEILVTERLIQTLTSPPPVEALAAAGHDGQAQAVRLFRIDWKAPATWRPQPAASP